MGYLPTKRDRKLSSTGIKHWIMTSRGDKTSTWEHHTYRMNAAETLETQTRTNGFEMTLGNTNKNPRLLGILGCWVS